MSRLALAVIVASTALVACDTQSETYNYNTHSSIGPITEVIVDLDSGRVGAVGVHSTSTPVTQVEATAVANWYGEAPTVEFIEQGTVLRIEAMCGRSDTCEIDLSIEMPPGAILRVNGDHTDVEVESLDGPTTIATETGDVTLTKLSGQLDVSTRHGSIVGQDLAMSMAEVQTFEGDIRMEFLKSFRSIVADTVNGDIWLNVPGPSFLIEAKSGDGKVDIEVPTATWARHFIHAIASESGDIWIGPPR